MKKDAPAKEGTASARSRLSMVGVALFDLAAGAVSMWAAVLLRYRFEETPPPDATSQGVRPPSSCPLGLQSRV